MVLHFANLVMIFLIRTATQIGTILIRAPVASAAVALGWIMTGPVANTYYTSNPSYIQSATPRHRSTCHPCSVEEYEERRVERRPHKGLPRQ